MHEKIYKIIKTLKKFVLVGDPTPEGSITLVSNLLLVVVNIGLDILGKFN